jgi:hypothetical protein
MKFTPAPLFNKMVLFYSQNKHRENPASGRRELPKIYNNGSSRSSKTYSAIQLIITFCDHNRKNPLYIGVFRDTLVDCRKYTYKDFVECIKMMDLYSECQITEFPNPKIKLWGSTIEFMGLPEPNKQPPRTDICFFNEATEITDKTRVRGLLMRCEMLAIFDWNPSYSSHWVFDGENEFNALFTRTTYLDNPFLTDNIISNIESYCPWDFKDSHIEQRGCFNVRVWDKPEDERTPNQKNIDAGTADRWYWLVYGEGIPCAREGAVFPNVEWIREFPDTGFDEVILSADFGYTSDNTTLIRTGRKGLSATIEAMVVQPTSTPEICYYAMKPSLLREVERRRSEGIMDSELWICCESQDRYGTDTFVDGLNNMASQDGYNWNFFKISKSSIIAGVAIMHRFKLTLVHHNRFQIEQQNYVYRMINGETTNEPDPASKFCDIWDGARYGFQHYFYWING